MGTVLPAAPTLIDSPKDAPVSIDSDGLNTHQQRSAVVNRSPPIEEMPSLMSSLATQMDKPTLQEVPSHMR